MPLPWLITRDYLLWQIEIEIFPTHFVGVAPSVNSPHSDVSSSSTALASVSGHCHYTNIPHDIHTHIHTYVPMHCSASRCVRLFELESASEVGSDFGSLAVPVSSAWRSCTYSYFRTHIHIYKYRHINTQNAVSCNHSLTAGIGRTFTPNACWVTVNNKNKYVRWLAQHFLRVLSSGLHLAFWHL